MKVFLGYDPREALGTWVFQHSVLKRASTHVEFIPLNKHVLTNPALKMLNLPASNDFIYSRYLCAALSGYRGGPVLFADGADQICLSDISELFDLWQSNKAVQVVKRNDYTPSPMKFIGTDMESPNKAYPKKQWSSVMLINPGHYGWRRIDWTQTDPMYYHGFKWLDESEIGDLPPEWNRLIDEGDTVDGKILHWTLGVPAMHKYRHAPGYGLWWNEAKDAMNICDKRWLSSIASVVNSFQN